MRGGEREACVQDAELQENFTRPRRDIATRNRKYRERKMADDLNKTTETTSSLDQMTTDGAAAALISVTTDASD
jgi:hypothetical protein